MSFSLKIVDGDLVQEGSTLGVVFGTAKLKQDIDHWLRERYGGDRFHTNLGSILQDFIGGVVSLSTRQEIQDEVLRVLQNYQEMQRRLLKTDPQLLSYSEMLMSIDSIKTYVNYDSVTVQIRVRNGVNESETIIAGAAA